MAGVAPGMPRFCLAMAAAVALVLCRADGAAFVTPWRPQHPYAACAGRTRPLFGASVGSPALGGSRPERPRAQPGSSRLRVRLHFWWTLGRPRVPGGQPLEVGDIVGHHLERAGQTVTHAAIYVGRGRRELEAASGERLTWRRHYVVELGGAPGDGEKILSGSGSQRIQLTPMDRRKRWFRHEIIDDPRYGEPHSGDETKRRALSRLTAEVPARYDLLFNNCQHFAVWAKYGKRRMLPCDQDRFLPVALSTTAGAVACAGVVLAALPGLRAFGAALNLGGRAGVAAVALGASVDRLRTRRSRWNKERVRWWLL